MSDKAGLGLGGDPPDERTATSAIGQLRSEVAHDLMALREQIETLQIPQAADVAATTEQLSGQVRQIEAVMGEYRAAILTLGQRLDALARSQSQGQFRAMALNAVAHMRQPGDTVAGMQKLAEWSYNWLIQDVAQPPEVSRHEINSVAH